MKKRLLPFALFVLLTITTRAQIIQGSIRYGASPNQVEIWIRPDFTNTNVQYLFQLGFPVAWPVSGGGVIQPGSVTAVQDPSFTAAFGTNYSLTPNPIAHNTANTENYVNFVLVRGGAGASNPQSWTAGTEYKVLTVTFNPATTPNTPVKLVDYQDGGSDGQGNFYTVDGNANYYVSSTSTANFYAIPGQSIVGGTALAGYAQTTSNVPLPVNLFKFNGFKNGTKNTLQWSTANEENNLGFEVQRSTDGAHYTPIAFVNTRAANGTSSSILDYSFDDNSPAKKQYYRLKQVDFDGRTKISQIIVIDGEKALSLSVGGIFPNPAEHTINVIINAPKSSVEELMVIDLSGKVIKRQIESIGTGSNSIPIDVSNLSKGTYLVQLKSQSNDQPTTAKFIKQ